MYAIGVYSGDDLHRNACVHTGMDRELDMTMDTQLFAELMGSVAEADERLKGECSPSRERPVCPVDGHAIQKATGLSQQKIASIPHVEGGRLRT